MHTVQSLIAQKDILRQEVNWVWTPVPFPLHSTLLGNDINHCQYKKCVVHYKCTPNTYTQADDNSTQPVPLTILNTICEAFFTLSPYIKYREVTHSTQKVLKNKPA